MKKIRQFDDYLIESLKKPQEARAYLNVALEEYAKDHDSEAFLLALRDVAAARGGLTNLAKKTKLNRQNLYRALSNQGNPQLDTLSSVLSALGLRLSIEQTK
jgi:probable addiction module antidote protein